MNSNETATTDENPQSSSAVAESYSAGQRHEIWKPKKDISAHEMALCIPVLTLAAAGYGSQTVLKKAASLPDKARRHFDLPDLHPGQFKIIDE